jgi:biopolymer transport protein ExbB/TolQ
MGVTMNERSKSDSQPRFSWFRDDLECRIGVRGGRFTRVNNTLWVIVAVVLTVAFYGAIAPFPSAYFNQVFTQRGKVQYVEVLFSFWALIIVLAKWSKVKLQQRALEFKDLVPVSPDFVLSPATVGDILHRLREACDDPTKFVLFARIELALSNLKNMGQITEVDSVLQSQAGNDEDMMESSYSLVKGLIWAIPVLGFIGTVQGLGMAIGSFGGVLSNASDLSQLKPALQGVTAGLSTAFDTTFVALVAALGIQLLLVVVRKTEEEMLDGCKDYCQRHIVGRLRLTPFDQVG